MAQLNPNKAGLGVGAFYGVCHTGWVILVAAGAAKPLMDGLLALHFLSISYTVNGFRLTPALTLVLVTSLIGYAQGWIFAKLWNSFDSSGKERLGSVTLRL